MSSSARTTCSCFSNALRIFRYPTFKIDPARAANPPPSFSLSTNNHESTASARYMKRYHTSLWQGHSNRLSISSSTTYNKNNQFFHREYSTTQLLRLRDKESPSSSSSYSDMFRSQADKWWNKGVQITNQAVKSTSSATKDAASKTLHRTKQLTKTTADKVSKTASESLTAGKKKLDQTLHQSPRHLQESASKLTVSATQVAKKQATNLTRTTAESVTKATQTVGQVARDAGRATKQATTNAVENNIHQPIKATSKHIRETAQQLVENITSSGTKLLRWVAVWSLAAIFVYDIASTTPMAILKYMTKDDEQRSNKTVKEAEPKQQVQQQQQQSIQDSESKPFWKFWA